MTTLTWVRVVLLLIGVALFAWALRTGEDWARYTAIGVLVVAIVVRFFDRARTRR